jgi:hypothetical protein
MDDMSRLRYLVLVLIGFIPNVACPQQGERWVDVQVTSSPDSAAVYFIPIGEYQDSLLDQPLWLERYRVQEGPTNVVTRQRELRYVVVFVRNGARQILWNVQVADRGENRVAVTFPEEADTPPAGSLEIWSNPDSGRVYVVLGAQFEPAMLGDTNRLASGAVASGRATFRVNLPEGTYVVVIVLGGQRAVIFDVRVRQGESNRTGVEF